METGFRDPFDPLAENFDFDDEDDGRTIVGTILFKSTESLLRVRNSNNIFVFMTTKSANKRTAHLVVSHDCSP